MTSLIFGTIYLGHKGIVGHRREKQRQKNYERWEGLRDEYDEQRKISRESRSLDIQRTGADSYADPDKPILTLRDQQEANDARTSWRPQESFDAPRIPLADDTRRASVDVTSGTGLRPLYNTKTGSTWDEGLPQPLRVSRRTWDEYQPSNLSRSGSVRNESETQTPRDRSTSTSTPSGGNKNASPRPDEASPISPTAQTHAPASRSMSTPTAYLQQESIQRIEHQTPGGRMAELIELGKPEARPTTYSSHPPAQSFGGFQPNPYHAQGVQAPPADGSMQEWWNRP